VTTLRDALARALDANGHVDHIAQRYGRFNGAYYDRAADRLFAALRSDPEVLTAFAEALDWCGWHDHETNEFIMHGDSPELAARLLDHLLGSRGDWLRGRSAEPVRSACMEWTWTTTHGPAQVRWSRRPVRAVPHSEQRFTFMHKV
jgi:hypothetical protein